MPNGLSEATLNRLAVLQQIAESGDRENALNWQVQYAKDVAVLLDALLALRQPNHLIAISHQHVWWQE